MEANKTRAFLPGGFIWVAIFFVLSPLSFQYSPRVSGVPINKNMQIKSGQTRHLHIRIAYTGGGGGELSWAKVRSFWSELQLLLFLCCECLSLQFTSLFSGRKGYYGGTVCGSGVAVGIDFYLFFALSCIWVTATVGAGNCVRFCGSHNGWLAFRWVNKRNALRNKFLTGANYD